MPAARGDAAVPGHTSDLIQQIKESADKLAADHTSRGDLKILSRTLRELRYAFKVFAPYRSLPQGDRFRLRPHAAESSHLSAGGRVRPGDGRTKAGWW